MTVLFKTVHPGLTEGWQEPIQYAFDRSSHAHIQYRPLARRSRCISVLNIRQSRDCPASLVLPHMSHHRIIVIHIL